jgi:phage terminase large subunit
MKLIFNTNGNEKQKEMARAWIDPSISDIVYGGSKGSGKSFGGVNLIFGDAFLYPETHYFIARKKLNDIRKFTIPTIHEVFNFWGITKNHYQFNGTDNFYTLYNGSKVFLLDAKYLPSDPLYMRFGSMQMTRGMIEEAGEFEIEAKQNLHASIGRWKNDKYNLKGKLLQTCNPSKNYLYKDYYKPHKLGQLEPYKKFIQALPEDNKMLDAGYLENLSKILSKNAKERLLKGNWEYDDDPNVLCEYDNILNIFKNNHVQKTGKKYIICDVARLGSDKAIISVWDGWVLIEIHIFDLSRTTEIQTAINGLRIKHQIAASNCLADEDGVGGGVVDNCRIKGFVNNSRPFNNILTGKAENFYNLQSQCGYKLAEIINANSIYIECDLSDKHKEEIIEELEQLKSYDTDSDGRVRIMPKEKVKENIGRSPDFRDILLMRAYYEFTGTATKSFGSF